MTTMSGGFADKLREEIHMFLKMRHDFIMRKFSFCTGLLGLGSLSLTTAENQQFILSNLLYLVPLVAIAFDFQIATEDHRIKRAGIFLRQQSSAARTEEKAYEEFVSRHSNKVAPFAFCIVTLIMLMGSAFILWQTSPPKSLFFSWIGVIMIVEVMILTYVVKVRTFIGNRETKKEKASNTPSNLLNRD